jgi:branched-chain amino acid transport system permease protein
MIMQSWASNLRSVPVCLAVVAVMLFLAAPFLVYPVFVMKLLCFALYAAAFNLLIGYVGLLSFGHAAFFGGGAYMAAHAMAQWGVTPEVALLIAMGFAAAQGAGVGYLAIRRQGIYFSMITLALAQLFFFFFLQAPFTGGENGIQNVPRGHLFGLVDLAQPVAMYYFTLAVVGLGYLFTWRVVRSPFGTILRSIRENEARAVSLGYRVERYKFGAFVLSAMLTGLAGGLKALVFQLATLTDVNWHMSGEVVIMALMGGIGTIFGPLVGSAIIVSLEHVLAASTLPVPVVIGSIFIVFVLVFRKGVVGEVQKRMSRNRPAPRP